MVARNLPIKGRDFGLAQVKIDYDAQFTYAESNCLFLFTQTIETFLICSKYFGKVSVHNVFKVNSEKLYSNLNQIIFSKFF
jgi:hypothetical protein